MENNENNVQNQVNETVNKPQKSGKKVTIILGIIVLILVLAVGVLAGLFISGNGNKITNQIEEKVMQGNENKVSKKIDESKDWVYDADYLNGRTDKTRENYKASRDLIAPFININSDDAKKANEEIKALYEELYSEFTENIEVTKGINQEKVVDGSAYAISSMKYEFIEKDNILSILLTYDRGAVPADSSRAYKTYNFNLGTLKYATVEEVGKACGFSSEADIKEKINIAMENAGSEAGIFEDTVWDGKRFFINKNAKLNIVLPGPALGEITLDVDKEAQRNSKSIDDGKEKDNQEKSNNNSSNEVVNVVGNQVDYKYMIISGKNAKNETVWEYRTPESNHPENIVNQAQKLIGTKNGKVYLCDWGKLYILDEQKGSVLYSNTRVNIGGAAVTTFDKNNNLYTASYLAPVYKFDENGKELLNTQDLWNSGFITPSKMYMSSDKYLTIEYKKNSGEYDNIVDIDTNTLMIEKVKSTYQSDITGKYTIARGPLNIVALSEDTIFYSFRLVRENGNMGFVDGYASKQNDGSYISNREENKVKFVFEGKTVNVTEQYDEDKHTMSSPECGGGVYLANKYVKE